MATYTDDQIRATIAQYEGMAGLDPFVRFGVAMAREVLALREALGAVCDACTKIATFDPGGELSFDRWDRGHRAGWRMAGKIATQALEDTSAARALLDLGNGD